MRKDCIMKKSEQDDEKDQDDIQMPSVAENVIEDFDLMGSDWWGSHPKCSSCLHLARKRRGSGES